MPATERYIPPHQWAKEAWRDSRLDILVPMTAGLAGGQFLMALFGLRSYHTFFLLICLAASAYAAIRTAVFLSQVTKEEREGNRVTLTSRDAQELFLPLVLSVVIYGIIAPNLTLGFIFACVSLPHAVALLYLTRRYADIVPTPETERFAFTFPPLDRAALVSRAQRVYFSARALFRRTPDFTSH